ncbi:MAG: SpvB/TcaC N-terminal domain-containing protein [Ginsengibacter sp.]
MTNQTDNKLKSSQFLSTERGRTKSNAIDIPSISLPKGGGAVKGIDEKFSVNAINGTASFSIPLPFSTARGASPSLSLSYNSGSGNGVFGLGWSLSLPSVSRKADNPLPQYLDAGDSDIFLFSGAEDLVPSFKKKNDGSFDKDVAGNYIVHEKNSSDGFFTIRFYQPRIEGFYARIERWMHKISGEIKWRIISKENITTLFGWSVNARIADPGDENRIFEWLPEFVFDAKGNCSHYLYKKEDEAGFDISFVHNRNRKKNNQITYANTYLEKILYGNKMPYEKFGDAFPVVNDFLFSNVFDYGEYNEDAPFDKVKEWDCRPDSFSNYKAGYEIRTTRICKRVLLFHHFTGDGEYDGLVRSLNFSYQTAIEEDFSFLNSLTSIGYIKKPDGSYTQKKLPPVEFTYQAHEWNQGVKNVSEDDLVHAPAGIDEQNYQFTDLYNEGLVGILSEQAGGWFYKRNLSNGHFAESELVPSKPSFGGLGSVLQLADLDADGGKQLVSLGARPSGFFELGDDNQWQQFRSFHLLPNIDFNDPNTRMLDLNGDGRPEIMIADENVFSWYPSEGRKGYNALKKAATSYDEEEGPQLVFANNQQSIFLADMSGDGLTDLVRIKNNEVCYWPNMGYGKFGAKVQMDHAPKLDHADAFNPSNIKLADIDGSGTTDIIYLGKNNFTCWKNLSGNRFSITPFVIGAFPEIHPQSKVTITDFLGNGTACIVWSGMLAKDNRSSIKYIDLMNSKKPHVMVAYQNNMGKEVSMEYAPSTKFYIDDKNAQKPWVTKLHFPVHCIASTTTRDKISGYKFVSAYRYHHGYYDHKEREFRGFGMVEQIDAESFENWAKGDASNITDNTLHQEPVVSKTWFHTGAFIGKENILNQFKEDYWYNESGRQGLPATHNEKDLPDARLTVAKGIDVAALNNLTGEEWQQALRACKGMALRAEVFAIDAAKFGNTDAAIRKELTPFSVSTHNCFIELIQPKGKNKYAVFTVKESESITYNYERNADDPRIAHNLNIKLDEYGNVLESAAVVYPRLQADLTLPAETQNEQGELVIIYAQNTFTNGITDDTALPDQHHLPLPSEAKTCQLKNVTKTSGYYTPSDFEDILTPAKSTVAEYHELSKLPDAGKAQQRLIEHVRTVYYKNDLTGDLPLNQLEYLALPNESYQLAYTLPLVEDIFGTPNIAGAKISDSLLMNEGKFIRGKDENGIEDTNWWIRSGKAQYLNEGETATDASNRFYAPVFYADPLDAVTKVKYGSDYFIFISETEDPFGNTTAVEKFNFRTMSPQKMRDVNGNFSEAICDELGLVKAFAVMGKGNEADNLTGLTEATDIAESAMVGNYLNAADSVLLTTIGKNLLQNATAWFVHDFENYLNSGKPVLVSSISREEHFAKNNNSPVQIRFEYANGLGEVIMKKVQAEPGMAKQAIVHPDLSITVSTIDTSSINPQQLRWIGNGRVVKNNKGSAVKQYEPYFSVTHHYEDSKELVETGVTPFLYYDAAGRLVKTFMPDGTFSKVEFDAWKQKVYDANDTVTESDWYLKRTDNARPDFINDVKEQQAAAKAAKHVNTPATMHFDSLGRPVLSVDYNKNINTDVNEFYFTKTNLDAEGNLLSVTDARQLAENGNKGNVVMRYKYDMLGNKVYQQSMDAGQRWLLTNISGIPLRTWDERNHEFQYFYDVMHRPVSTKILGGDGANSLDNIFEKIIYGENLLAPGRANEAALQANNVLGKPVQYFDTAGLIITPEYDFKGEPNSVTRRLFAKYKSVANWINANLETDLEPDAFTYSTETDALGRITRQTAPDASIIVPSYNESGLLNGEKVLHKNTDNSVTERVYIKDISYTEKGQRQKIIYGNDVSTSYNYDNETFRLNRLVTKRLNNDILQDWLYTFDAVGNITHIEDQVNPVEFYKNQMVSGIAGYTYDALYRLVEASGRENDAALTFNDRDNCDDKNFVQELSPSDPLSVRSYIQKFTYDEVGNIQQMKHLAGVNGNWTRNYTYETNNNRIKSTLVGDIAAPVNYTKYTHHAQHGFILELPNLQEMDWNFKEELIKTIQQKRNDGGTPEITYYQYDGSGQRIRKITENAADATASPTKKEERIYISSYELFKKHSGPNAGLQRESLSLTDDGHRFVMIETRNGINDGTEPILTRYQLHNHLGSAALELDDTSNVISYEEYHPFGTTAYQVKNAAIRSAAKRYRYTGMERDEETGLEYHSARYYLPWLGRWLSSDPIGIGDGINLYAYCGNNPVLFNDPSGMSGEDDEKPSQLLDLESMFAVSDGASSGGSGRSPFAGLLDTLSAIGTAIGNAVIAAGRWIADAASTAWNWIKEAAVAAWNWTKEAVTTAWNWIKGAAQTAWDWTKNAVSTAWNWIKEAASTAWEWTKQAAAATWNWFLAPLIRTATNALGGFIIGFLTGNIAGGVIGAVTGGVTGAIHGWAMADAHSYNWTSVSGWVGFLADNTWGLPNSMVGSLFATANIIGGNPIDRTNSRDSNALMFENEWFSGYATTLGNVIVGTRGLSHDVVEHELAHVLQARIFGPLFYPSMIAHYVFNTLFPFWLIYHNARYPNTPIRNFGEYFSRGVYPHTWAEEWGYAVGGHPN